MQRKTKMIGQDEVGWYESGTGHTDLLFCHANGFPPPVYRCFLEQLAVDFRIISAEQRGLWPNQPAPHTWHWKKHAADLAHFVESHFDYPIAAMGHSMGGAIIVLAAASHPQLFSKIVLIDPVLVPARFGVLSALTPRAMKNKMPMISKTLTRPNVWESPEECAAFHSTKAAGRRCAAVSLN